MVGNAFYYIGVVMVVVGQRIWVALMSINLAIWKRDNPDKVVPLAMFANVAGSYLWGWTAVGAALEIIFQILPVALGLTSTIDAGLARVFFSWTLHAIVYFWLIPTYIAYYTIFPRDRRRLHSDAMGRDFLHPVRGRGDADRRASLVCRSAGRRRLQRRIRCSPASSRCRRCSRCSRFAPWRRSQSAAAAEVRSMGEGAALANPIMLATALSPIMLGFEALGGLINMSYQLNTSAAQHAVDHRPLPSDLRRRHRDHVFLAIALRPLAASDRPRAESFG